MAEIIKCEVVPFKGLRLVHQPQSFTQVWGSRLCMPTTAPHHKYYRGLNGFSLSGTFLHIFIDENYRSFMFCVDRRDHNATFRPHLLCHTLLIWFRVNRWFHILLPQVPELFGPIRTIAEGRGETVLIRTTKNFVLQGSLDGEFMPITQGRCSSLVWDSFLCFTV